MAKIQKLDVFDKIILKNQIKDARISLKNLARITKRSKSFVQYRLNNLDKKIIEKIYPLIDIPKFGFIPFEMYIKTKMNESEEEKFIEKIKKEEKVFYIERLIGDFSVKVSFFERSINSSVCFSKKILKGSIEKIKDIKINIISKLIKTNNCFFSKTEGKPALLFENKSNYHLNKKELKVLQILNKNPKLSVTEISLKGELSREFVKKTIQKLEKEKIIVGYSVDVDVESLGFIKKLFLIKMNVCDEKNYENFIDYLCSCPEINIITIYYPNQLILLEIIVGENYNFRNLKKKILNKFSDLIKKTESFDCYDEKKYNSIGDFLEKL